MRRRKPVPVGSNRNDMVRTVERAILGAAGGVLGLVADAAASSTATDKDDKAVPFIKAAAALGVIHYGGKTADLGVGLAGQTASTGLSTYMTGAEARAAAQRVQAQTQAQAERK